MSKKLERFLQFLAEREKSEHEPELRRIASEARSEMYHSGFKNSKQMSKFGDCGHVAHAVTKKLHQNGYKSAHIVDGYYNRDKDERKYTDYSRSEEEYE